MARKNARKINTSYQTPPEPNFKVAFDISVGNMNHTFATEIGPQRNRPADSPKWRSSLANRAKAYANVGYNPLLVRQRIASYRGDGKYYPLDGNGSNHWYEKLFGPTFCPPTGTLVIDVRNDDGTPNYAAENRIMQDVQVAKNMTVTERFNSDREFDDQSKAYQVNKAVTGEGFFISQRTMDARSLGSTVADKIRTLDPNGLLETTLAFVKETFPSAADSFAKVGEEGYKEASRHNYERTNGSFLVAVATMLLRPSTDKDRLRRALQSQPISVFSDGARGKGAEIIVLPRIESAYERTV